MKARQDCALASVTVGGKRSQVSAFRTRFWYVEARYAARTRTDFADGGESMLAGRQFLGCNVRPVWLRESTP